MKNIFIIYLIISMASLNVFLLNVKKDSARLKPILTELHYITFGIISFTPVIHLAVIVVALLNKTTIDIYSFVKDWNK